MKTRMKYFVLVFVILAFFIFNLSGCKGKSGEDKQIKQKSALSAEEVKNVKLESKEELLPPKLIWEKVINTKKVLFKQELHFVDKTLKEKLISENPELSKLFANENLYPFILLKGKSKQYLYDGKGNIKEIAYPPTDLVSEHNYDAFGEFTIKRRNGEVLWKKTVGKDMDKDGYWDEFFDMVLFSPDKKWLIIYYSSEMDTPDYFTHIAFDINGIKLWEHSSPKNLGNKIDFSTIRAVFSKDSKCVYFTKAYKLMRADKKGIIWETEVGDVHDLIISDSGKYIFVHGWERNGTQLKYKAFLINGKGRILWKIDTKKTSISTEVCAFDDNEKYIFVVGSRGSKFSILRISDGKVIKNILWCKPGSPLYKRLWGYPAYLREKDSRIALSVSSEEVQKEGDLFVSLYDISHLTEKEN